MKTERSVTLIFIYVELASSKQILDPACGFCACISGYLIDLCAGRVAYIDADAWLY